ncbi:MAG TPA: SBBP repeat-containing protein [Candidatus Cloacimonas acidaminovorans]|nr:MAG: flagellar basal body rod modification protein [Candidatus Cloacimonetes bacterium ADurb.Bin003]HOD60091.1 SBBP repeat-containing protein [Candidatus Syntrophosphaera sp.]HPI42975.1 SBBP repeat-containing protein [Candidatus Cloacimonas acidaminovorans]HPX58550.1 SBBP repeat-containing protein [Candidatus Cloacimonas acidaminovorans]HQM17307.1 SBBP repeat-containing protein [Candidatus Cloacimonas sp.]
MKKILLLIIMLLCSVALFSQYEPWLWAKQATGTNSFSAYKIAVDIYGNSYVSGYFYDEVTFGNITLNSNGMCDIFIAKLDPEGNWLWASKAECPSDCFNYGIAVDSNGNCYVTGWFNYEAIFGEIILNGNGEYYNEDIYIAKLDSNGNWLWAQKAGGISDDCGWEIAVDSNGNCYVIGNFFESATFGTTILESSGSSDIFVAKLDNDGSWLWIKTAGGEDNDFRVGIDINTDNNGNIYITGYFQGDVSFDSTTLSSKGNYFDIFVAKLDNDGNWLWAKQAGGDNNDFSKEIMTDIVGNSYITGTFSGNATFGSTTLSSVGETDIFVAKLSSNGNWLWAKQAGGINVDNSSSITLDSSENCYITGTFRGSATFGSTTLSSVGETDIFVAKLSSNGNWLWAKQAGGINDDSSWSIDVDENHNCYITGNFYSTVSFGGIELTNLSNRAIFVVKFNNPDYPNNVFIEDADTGINIRVSGGHAYKGSIENFPDIPDQDVSYTKLSFILDNSIENWTITMWTDADFGAYYQNEEWHIVDNNGGQVVFNISFAPGKGIVEIPVILDNPQTLSVQLSAFTLNLNSQYGVNVKWISQSETGLNGYYIHRGTVDDLSQATIISPLIRATNTSHQQVYLYTDKDIYEPGTYYYWLAAQDYDGYVTYCGSRNVIYSIDNNQGTPELPLVTEIKSIFPNPFNPTAIISYTISKPAEVNFAIYNPKGQLIRSFNLGRKDAGNYRLVWDGTDNKNQFCGTGVYYIRMQAGKESFIKKAALLK